MILEFKILINFWMKRGEIWKISKNNLMNMKILQKCLNLNRKSRKVEKIIKRWSIKWKF